MKIWKKSYYCDCASGNITISHDYEDKTSTDSIGTQYIDVAFFKLGFDSSGILGWKERLRWCWEIFRRGTVWCDMVILNQSTARKLGIDLLKFSEIKVKK